MQNENTLLDQESHVRLLTKNLKEYALITLDPKGCIRSWNVGAENLMGYSEHEAVGKHTSLFFTEEDISRGIDKKEMREAARRGRAEDERWHVRKDGSSFWGSGLMIPLKVRGRLIGFAKIFRDRTLRMRQERRKDDFIGFAGHELRTPLSILKNNIQLLELQGARADAAQNKKILAGMNEQIDTLSRLIDDLLDLTLIASGQLRLRREHINLRQLLGRVVEEYKNITLSHRIMQSKSPNAYVHADMHMLKQVIQNLINNAIKYSPPNTKIQISLETNKKQAIVSVRDYGIGIPKEKLRWIFDRFYRVDNKRETAQGLGIGLYVSLEIIKAHGGRMEVESTINKGSRFYFYLPKEKTKAARKT
jgi:PAS domain S-box-containing protein